MKATKSNGQHPSAQHDRVDAMRERIDRLTNSLGGDVSTITLTANVRLADHLVWTNRHWVRHPWVAVVSSRLGHNPVLHRDVCHYLSQSMMECRRRNAVLLVAQGSAIQPWAKRASELFGIPMIEIAVTPLDAKNITGDDSLILNVNSTDSAKLSRDEVVIFLADRVEAIHVRRKGKIAAALSKRLSILHDATTRVAVTSLPNCAAKELIHAGAIGWIDADQLQHHSDESQNEPSDREPDFADDWMHDEGAWLVHCTRRCDGPWPGQTDHQYRDDLLLGETPTTRTPLDTLKRIIRSRRLIASAIASAKAYPVVCLSAVALADLLISRSYRSHLKRWDYEPWGLAIRKSAAISAGVQEAIYGESAQRDKIAPADQFRFQAAGKTYDWTAEKEFRSAGDMKLDAFAPEDIRVFVATEQDAQQIKKQCPWRISVIWQSRPKSPHSV